jgi:N-acetylmuramoyl-L-alanine amidase
MRGLKPDSPLVQAVHASPNQGERRRPLDALVLHYTGMVSVEAALRRLCDPAAEVSSHYLVCEDGAILQLVPEARRAWHAGQSFWAGERDMNSASIGIEIANGGPDFGSPPFPPAQIAATIALCRDICHRHKIPAYRVLAHSDIAPSRKADPGETFPWGELAQAGIGHYVPPAPIRGDGAWPRGQASPAVAAFQSGLARYGYEIAISGAFDEQTEIVVRAFQRHFRPARVDGKADRSTLLTLDALLDALPN